MTVWQRQAGEEHIEEELGWIKEPNHDFSRKKKKAVPGLDMKTKNKKLNWIEIKD